MRRTRSSRRGATALLLVALAASSCARSQGAREVGFTELAPPVAAGAMAPHLAVDGDDLLLSWLEPGHRFLVARLHHGRWSAPALIAEGSDFFANWADVPKVGVAGDRTLWAHWLAKTGDETYAYGISLARSTDDGVTWRPMGFLHDDATPTEHGFVAYAPEGSGLRALWLDGREMAEGGAMTLRSARLDEAVGSAELVDDRVCDCCPTAMAATTRGAVALYRDRSLDEVRDIGVRRLVDGKWSALRPLHEDGWQLSGCPVNGPAVDAAGDRVAAAWFTAEGGKPRVLLAFSRDGGGVFEEPRVVDGERPLGRVGLALDGDGSAWVSWLTARESVAEVTVARFGAAGLLERRTVAATGASRASGIPRLARAGESLYLAWIETEDDQPARIRVVSWPVASEAASG